MNPDHRKTLTKNRTFIIDNIANPEDVSEKLYEKGFFTENMKQEVEAEKTDVSKVRKILDLIPKRGEHAFDGMYASLVDTDNGIVADRLQPGLAEKRKAQAADRPVTQNRYGDPDHMLPVYQRDVLPERWPDDMIMNLPVEVIRCDHRSHIVKDYWANDSVYKMRKRYRGRCFIISNKYFSKESKFGNRHGTEKDEDRARELFMQLFFDVVIYKDKTAEDMKSILREESQQEAHREAEAFVCILLSHGTTKGVCGVHGNTVSIDDITEMFDAHHCQRLRHKPKFFFIQACKGDNSDLGGKYGIRVEKEDQDECQILEKKMGEMELSRDQPDAQREEYPPVTQNADLPTKTDILVASATHPGLVSLRNIQHGSWFIQAVIYVFMKFAHKEDAASLLTMVSNLVSRGRTPSETIDVDMMQSPIFNTSLIKKCYFFPGLAE